MPVGAKQRGFDTRLSFFHYNEVEVVCWLVACLSMRYNELASELPAICLPL